MERNSVARIIEKFGTQGVLAAAIGIDPSAISHWKRRGLIPAHRQRQILEAATHRGIAVSPADFFEPAEDTGKASANAFLPYGRQHIEADDIAAVTEVLRGERLTTGPKVQAFEDAFAKTVGSRHAVAVSSGTAALHLALLAAGIGKGMSAIVPTLTFLATANCVHHAGAGVVFADCDPDSGLMRPRDLEEALERAGGTARAVLPVHLNGQCADSEAIGEIASAHGLAVIEDACHALGTNGMTRAGKAYRIGDCQFAGMATFSLHPVKTLAMGEGGVVTTNDKRLHTRLLRMRNHGMVHEADAFRNPENARDADGVPNPWYYEMIEPGFNYRASDIHCALGLSQIGKLRRFVTHRAELIARYERLLAPLKPLVRPLTRVPRCDPAWHLCAVLIDFAAAGVSRAEVMRRLQSDGIGSQVHFIPVHLQPYYAEKVATPPLPGALAYYQQILSLPLFVGMTDEAVERVVTSLARALSIHQLQPEDRP
jgi:UDP-4-amino-4,6-dideoxy-N-acetyl-beta-L-altrosamine transaminase